MGAAVIGRVTTDVQPRPAEDDGIGEADVIFIGPPPRIFVASRPSPDEEATGAAAPQVTERRGVGIRVSMRRRS
jgi:hypothetical protein